MAEIPAQARPLIRKAYLPVTVNGEGEGSRSHFGGRPWLPDDESWPTCPGCSRSMHLFAQIDLSDAPGQVLPLPRRGLLQLFYCTNTDPLCEVDLEAFLPFSAGAVVRVVVADGPGAIGKPLGIEPYPPRAITGWRVLDEVPNWEELRHLGITLEEAEEEALEREDIPRGGDKWLGWPAWVQGVEYVTCRQCGTSMATLLQIDSEDNVPTMFGDVGTGHVSVCPFHPEELSFHWACS